ncbi:hypothetical protein Cni_G05331 [Canna indica]|uniref:Uncharacterized protein n=1 Tax=Canna indica TaxID=4628 RepID=A0AAQ3Q5E0_9LILI|nr:hypothetical protein Cni_G05331 [Canna indica]
MTNPITQGISMNPIKNVTNPQSIKVRDAPRRSEANPAGDICAHGRRLAHLAAAAAGGCVPAASAGGSARWGLRRTARRMAQSSYMSPEGWSPPGISRTEEEEEEAVGAIETLDGDQKEEAEEEEAVDAIETLDGDQKEEAEAEEEEEAVDAIEPLDRDQKEEAEEEEPSTEIKKKQQQRKRKP